MKSKSFKQHVSDLREIFSMLDHYQMKLNLAKRAFFIKEGKFLRYMISSRGIRPNPKKVQAILDML